MKLPITNARLAFPDLFEAGQFQGTGPFNYRATFLIPAGDPQKARIEAAIRDVAKEKWGAKAPAILTGIIGVSNKCCFLDGDTKAYDGFAGNWALAASREQSKGRPTVIDRMKQPLAAADGIPYGGCYVNASVELWAQDNQYGKAVRATLLGVQFVRDGDSFGGGSPASPDDFAELAEGADASDLA